MATRQLLFYVVDLPLVQVKCRVEVTLNDGDVYSKQVDVADAEVLDLLARATNKIERLVT